VSYTYLQEQGAESSAASFSDIPAFVLSRLNLTAEKSCSSVSATESCRSSLSGMMSEPLTESRGAGLLMSSVEASHARTLASQEQGQELTGSGAAYGDKWRDSFAKYDPVSFSWRTAQCSLFGGLEEFSGTWPRWGSMRTGACFHAEKSAEFICENASSFSVPTLTKFGATGAHLTGKEYDGTTRHAMKIGQALRIPTPRSCSAMAAPITPSQVMEGRNPNLETVMGRLMLPTLGFNEFKGSSAKRFSGSAHFRGAKMSEGLRTCCDDPIYLNPSFAELVMMWPMGWTDLNPLATDKFPGWLQSHGRHSAGRLWNKKDGIV
jgi:hypothetical protein